MGIRNLAKLPPKYPVGFRLQLFSEAPANIPRGSFPVDYPAFALGTSPGSNPRLISEDLPGIAPEIPSELDSSSILGKCKISSS